MKMEKEGKERPRGPSEGLALCCRFQPRLAVLWFKRAKQCGMVVSPSHLEVP